MVARRNDSHQNGDLTPLSEMQFLDSGHYARLKAEEFRAENAEGLLDGVSSSGSLNFAALQSKLVHDVPEVGLSFAGAERVGADEIDSFHFKSREISESHNHNAQAAPSKKAGNEHETLFESSQASNVQYEENAFSADLGTNAVFSVAPVATAIIRSDNSVRNIEGDGGGVVPPSARGGVQNENNDTRNVGSPSDSSSQFAGNDGLKEHGRANGQGRGDAPSSGLNNGNDGQGESACDKNGDSEDCTFIPAGGDILTCAGEIAADVACISGEVINGVVGVAENVVEGLTTSAQTTLDKLTNSTEGAVEPIFETGDKVHFAADSTIEKVGNVVCDASVTAAECVDHVSNSKIEFVENIKGAIGASTGGLAESVFGAGKDAENAAEFISDELAGELGEQEINGLLESTRPLGDPSFDIDFGFGAGNNSLDGGVAIIENGDVADIQAATKLDLDSGAGAANFDDAAGNIQSEFSDDSISAKTGVDAWVDPLTGADSGGGKTTADEIRKGNDHLTETLVEHIPQNSGNISPLPSPDSAMNIESGSLAQNVEVAIGDYSGDSQDMGTFVQLNTDAEISPVFDMNGGLTVAADLNIGDGEPSSLATDVDLDAMTEIQDATHSSAVSGESETNLVFEDLSVNISPLDDLIEGVAETLAGIASNSDNGGATDDSQTAELVGDIAFQHIEDNSAVNDENDVDPLPEPIAEIEDGTGLVNEALIESTGMSDGFFG